jgi:AcrR family transcriptional regulator
MGTAERTAQRGPRAQRGEIAEQILARARESFAADGYAATTLQGVARAAGVDTKLVRYYFGNKDSLFDACLAFPEGLLARIRTAVDVPLPERGKAVVRAMLSAWANPDLHRVLRTSLLIAAHEPAAMDRVRAVFTDGLIPAIAPGLDPDEVSVRGGLVSSQMIGLAFARFIFALDDAAAIPDEQLVFSVGATVQHYLTDPLKDQ